MLGNLLTNYGETYFSQKSYNNHFGVPLSLSNLENYHRYGVFEIGMSRAGEIRKLSSLVRPHIGVITNVGESHIENFENLDYARDGHHYDIKTADYFSNLLIDKLRSISSE